MQNSKLGINRNTLAIAGVIIVVVMAGLFLFGGGHNTGQPSAPGGPGNAMQQDQGR